MQTIYIGVDFHARQQTICYLTTETGELVTCELKHQDKEAVRAFYAAFRGQVIVGLEASGYSPWFERLLEELGYEVWLGHATEIRRRARWRQKNDRRDAELILDLMLHNEFPPFASTSPAESRSNADAALPAQTDQDSHHEQKQFAGLGAASWSS
jgi:hypothetical protein